MSGARSRLAELATARQHRLDVTWLIIDDGGYGILREYMNDAFGVATGTELTRPDFVALAASFDIPAQISSADRLAADLAAALASPGPGIVVLPAVPRMFAPTHVRGDWRSSGTAGRSAEGSAGCSPNTFVTMAESGGCPPAFPHGGEKRLRKGQPIDHVTVTDQARLVGWWLAAGHP
ncbi:thiamine pyrophosphate-dependent enzyme [Streptosporangium soli]|nr:thiamine pyrophosphate-dependent enzyme [Streptosporangium sp. KLBMP 9127]